MRHIKIACPTLGIEEIDALKSPIASGWLTQGPEVGAFEEEFARKHQAEFAIAVTSCTTGLHLALEALGIGAGDEVIVPSFTWVATANAVEYVGAKPVFCDVDPTSFITRTEHVLKAVTRLTRAVVPVHLFGLCVDIDELRSALPDDVAIVEDAACAAGASTATGPAGSLGDIGVFSFHPRKIITTGEGGMVTLNDPDKAAHIRQLRDHGARPRLLGNPQPYDMPDFDIVGYNYRMTDLQAAIGRIQLTRLDSFVEERAKFAGFYYDALANIDWLTLPRSPIAGRHGWQAYVVSVEPDRAPASRNKIMAALAEKGIATRPGTHAVHTLTYYSRKYGLSPTLLPGALKAQSSSMAIPLHNSMEPDDYAYVADSIMAL